MKHNIRIILGFLLLTLSAVLCAFNEAENTHAARRSAQAAIELRSGIPVQSDPVPIRTGDPAEVGSDGFLGILTIPCLELELPVYSDWDAERLKTAPCRFSGSVAGCDLVIMAHNYRSHFGPIRRLKPGDDVIFTDLYGGTTCYRVSATATVSPDDTEAVTDSGYGLTLFTCTYGAGTRTVVFCTTEPSP